MAFDCLVMASRLSVPSLASNPLVSMVHGPVWAAAAAGISVRI